MDYVNEAIHFELIEKLEVANNEADVTNAGVNNADVNVAFVDEMATAIREEAMELFHLKKHEFSDFFLNYVAKHIAVFEKQGNSKGFEIEDAGKLFCLLELSNETGWFDFKEAFEKEGVWNGDIKVIQKEMVTAYPPMLPFLSGVMEGDFKNYDAKETEEIFEKVDFAINFLAKFCKENRLNAATLARRAQFLMTFDYTFFKALIDKKFSMRDDLGNADEFYNKNFRRLFKNFIGAIKGRKVENWRLYAENHTEIFEKFRTKKGF